VVDEIQAYFKHDIPGKYCCTSLNLTCVAIKCVAREPLHRGHARHITL
jgi:hypothetical protein